ncbi:MAG: glycosyltransferase family 39 protein [Candidatus Nanopelagicales bacterium]|nr:glycosyltransferase family 39 protein [Candidatus Nanopelagicales bacterium]
MSTSQPTETSDDASVTDSTSGRRCPRWLLPATSGLSLLIFVCGSWGPAYWLDEAITLHAVRRSWRDVVRLLQGDPSLVPYYLVMKPFAAISESELWMRLPGEVAMAGAATIVVWGMCRLFGLGPALLTGGVWLAIPAFSEYAQMIRPYAFLVLFTSLAAVSWWRSLLTDRRLWSVLYGACYLAVGLMHMYGLLVIIPLVFVALVSPVGSRRSSVLRTVIPVLLATVALSPYIHLAARNAPGPANIRELTPANLVRTLADAIGSPWLAAALLVMALIGLFLTRVTDSSQRRLRALAAAWAFGLPLVLVVAQVVGMRTLIPRYFLFAIPGLVVLAALGLWRLYHWWPPLGIAGLGIMVAFGVPGQLEVRQENGHRAGPVRQVAAAVNVPALAGLPVVARPADLTLRRLAAYAPEVIERRMPWYQRPEAKGKLMFFNLPPDDQLAEIVSATSAVVVVGETDDMPTNRSDWDPEALTVDEDLRAVGFTDEVIRCQLGNTVIAVQARPAWVTNLTPPREIIDQVQAAVPEAECAVG